MSESELEVEAVAAKSPWRRTFMAFADSNFRWFFASLLGSMASMNIQMFIRGWLVFELTGSYEKLGWMTAAGGIVGLVAAPFGGVVADRIRQKKHVIQTAQLGNATIAGTVGVLIATGQLQFIHLLIASVFQGLMMNIMMPARQALTKDVVGLERLTNAIALNTSGMNASRLLLPGIAGFMVAALGGGNGNIEPAKWVYFLMTGLYFSSVLLLFKVKVLDRVQSAETAEVGILDDLLSGFRYVLRTPTILMLLLCNFLMVFFSLTYFMLLPGFAKQVLNAGPDQLGLLISISGLGSLAGSLLVASMANQRRARYLLSGALVLGVALLGFASSTNYWLSVVFLSFVGLGQAARMSLSNVLIQSYVDDVYRGRVMSIYMLEMSVLSVAIYPISVLADVIGPQLTVGGSALLLIILVLVLFAYPRYRDLD
ncbi:MAG: MFS transporter [Pseudomonadales bacterium]